MTGRCVGSIAWAFVARVALSASAALLMAPTPAWAWGPLAQGIILERALDRATPRAPWLAAQREAVLWGGFATGVRWLPPARGLTPQRLLAPEVVRALEASAKRGRQQQGFAAGWLAAGEAEAVLAKHWPSGAAERWLASLPPEGRSLGLDWALDQALVGQASPRLRGWAIAAFWHAAGPGGLLAQPVAQATGLPLPLWAQWGQRLVPWLAQGPEVTMNGLQQLANWPGFLAEAGRAPAVRQALGEGPGPLAAAAEAASERLVAWAIAHADRPASGLPLPAPRPQGPPAPAPAQGQAR